MTEVERPAPAVGSSGKKRSATSVNAAFRWLVLPVALCLAGAALGQSRAGSRPGSFFGAPDLVTKERRAALESAPARALANAVWAFGDVRTVRRAVQRELDRLSGSSGPERARMFIRFGLIDTSPDGQRALFGQACMDDPEACADLVGMAQREADLRFVSPGNHLPMRLLPNQPQIPGH